MVDSRFEELWHVLADAANGLSAEQWTWRPTGKWCAAEILEHLYLTYTGTIKGFEKLMEADTPLATRATLRHRLRTVAVVGLGYLPEGRKAPPTTVPGGSPREKVRAEIGAKIQAMDHIIGQAEQRFGPGTKLLDHPILGSLTAAQWRKFHLVHGKHHAKQIYRLRVQMPRSFGMRETSPE